MSIYVFTVIVILRTLQYPTYVKLIWILSLLCANCMNLREETHCDKVSSLKFSFA
jgi:hypothetical protein